MPKFMKTAAARANPEHYAEMRKEQRRRYYAKTAGLYPPRRWEPWEDELVLQRVDGDPEKYSMTETELSSVLHRSVKAISNRRSRLNRNAASQSPESSS